APLALAEAVRARFKLSAEAAPLRRADTAATPAADAAPPASAEFMSRLRTRPDALDGQLARLALPPSARDWYFRQP
ncbi:MAG: hypothetical protein LBR12_03605, partial [Opitutaceae bacterium]|nr:hypothetical protein [Opitutaceae bacterium]